MIRSSRSSFAPLAFLLVVEIVAIIGLQQLGAAPFMQINWDNLSVWLNEPLELTVPPIVRLVALAVAYWMFLSTALFVVAQLSCIPAAIRATSMLTLPSVRRVVNGAMAVSIATGAVMVAGVSPAHASTSASTNVSSANATAQFNFGTGADTQVAQIKMNESNSVATPNPSGTGTATENSGQSQSGLSGTQGEQPAGDAAPTEGTGSETPAESTAPQAGDTISIPAGTGQSYVRTPQPAQPLANNGTDQAPAADSGTATAPAAPANQQTLTVPAQGNWSVATPSAKAQAATENSTPAPTTASPDGSNQGTRQTPATAGGTQVLGVQEHRVAAGENLWTIARDALQQTNGAAPSEGQVRDYWLKVIDANRDNLRSKDPHWIFAGEVVTLPAVGTTAN